MHGNLLCDLWGEVFTEVLASYGSALDKAKKKLGGGRCGINFRSTFDRLAKLKVIVYRCIRTIQDYTHNDQIYKWSMCINKCNTFSIMYGR